MGNSLCFQKQRHLPLKHDQYRPTCRCPYDRTNGAYHPCHDTTGNYKQRHFKYPRLKSATNCCDVDYGWKFCPGMPRIRPEDSRWVRPTKYPLRKDLKLARDQEQWDFRPKLHNDLQRPYNSSKNAYYTTRVKPVHYFEPPLSRVRRKYDYRIKQGYVAQRRQPAECLMERRMEDDGNLNFYNSEICERNDKKESVMHLSDTAANKLHEREIAPLATRASPVDLSSHLNDSRRSRLEHVQYVPEFEPIRIKRSSDWKSDFLGSQPARPPEPWAGDRKNSALGGLHRSKARVQFQEFKQVNHIYPSSLEVGLHSRAAAVPRDILPPHFPLSPSLARHSEQENLRKRFWHPRH